jgi:hypothetical protein
MLRVVGNQNKTNLAGENPADDINVNCPFFSEKKCKLTQALINNGRLFFLFEPFKTSNHR